MSWLSKKWAKRGQIASQAGAVTAFVVLVITAAIGALVVNNIDDTFTAGTAEANTTANGLLAFNNYSDLLPSVGTVLAAVLILGLVIGGLGRFGGR